LIYRFSLSSIPLDKIVLELEKLNHLTSFLNSYQITKLNYFNWLLKNSVMFESKLQDSLNEKIFYNTIKIHDMRLNIFQLKNENENLERELTESIDVGNKLSNEKANLEIMIKNLSDRVKKLQEKKVYSILIILFLIDSFYLLQF
jgi:hypothetical protein